MAHDEPMAAVQGDAGAILLIVLFVTTVLAVLIGVVLTNVEVNLRNTTVAQNLADKTYAADGGVEYVIQRLRQDPATCTDPNLTPWQQNGANVVVSCTPVSGPTSFDAGWAVVTTDPGSKSVSTASGNGIVIDGPTYVAGGIDLTGDLTVRDGPLVQGSTPCPLKSGGGQLLLSPIAPAPVCTTVPAPGGLPALPCIDAASCAPATRYNLVLRGPDPTYSTTSGGGCSIFLPGKYTSKPHLGAHNYFASGIYYFENVDTIDVNGVDVSGGNPGTEPSLVSVHPCATDDAAGVSDGSGVEWILGGTSAVSVGSALGTSFELFARQPAASALEGAAGISIRGVPAVAPGYMPSSSNVLSNVGGSSSELSVHGLVYAPDADILVSGTISIGSELSGGVVAKTLRLDPKGVATGGFGIVSSVGPPADRQLFTISSTASQGGGTKNVKTTAVIELKNDLNRSVVIDSWTTNLLTNPA